MDGWMDGGMDAWLGGWRDDRKVACSFGCILKLEDCTVEACLAGPMHAQNRGSTVSYTHLRTHTSPDQLIYRRMLY